MARKRGYAGSATGTAAKHAEERAKKRAALGRSVRSDKKIGGEHPKPSTQASLGAAPGRGKAMSPSSTTSDSTRGPVQGSAPKRDKKPIATDSGTSGPSPRVAPAPKRTMAPGEGKSPVPKPRPAKKSAAPGSSPAPKPKPAAKKGSTTAAPIKKAKSRAPASAPAPKKKKLPPRTGMPNIY